jgi:hypothetical protein
MLSALLLFFASFGFLMDGRDANASTLQNVGGNWIHPHDPHAAIGSDGVLVLEVEAHGNGVSVGEVKFTTDWAGWHVLCTDGGANDHYSCEWNMRRDGVPIGQEVAVSFDVYGSDGTTSNLAPNGIHHVKWGFPCITANGNCGGY